MKLGGVLAALGVWATTSFAGGWEKGAPVPEGGCANSFNYSDAEFSSIRARGQIYAFQYPVEVTGSQLPYEAIKRFLEDPSENPLRTLLQEMARGITSIRSFDQVLAWLGLHKFPETQPYEELRFSVPEGFSPGDRMGLTLFRKPKATGFTFSCAGCHVGQLFGRPILGLTNRFPRANEFFVHGSAAVRSIPTDFFTLGTAATPAEAELYRYTRENVLYVSSKIPEAMGLDTSLAHVALSLARRGSDPYAEKYPGYAYFPREEKLADFPSDSKPAVWWNAKYKNRWLSDGSVVAGNPILTNLLWNDIGRGTDLHDLEGWIEINQEKIKELTTAVFSVEAPRITRFFPAERIDLESAKRGEPIFNQRCAKCHGHYEKGWSSPESDRLNLADQLATTHVRYSSQTKVINVGTDPYRREGMASLLQLNHLAISQRFGVQVEVTNGYVPQPLVGIWARWPYFHNNSIPSLCALLTRAEDRPKAYYSGEPNDSDRDFDFECNGYPLGNKVPEEWKSWRHRFNTRSLGLSNAGHDEGIFLKDGQELLSPQDKRDLIRFMQTL